MYQTRNYYNQNLGTAGHRATSSYSYMPQYTPNNYYNQNPIRPVYHPSYQQHMKSASFGMQNQFGDLGHHFIPQAPPPLPQQPQVNGGINSVLEYDINHMSTFLSWCAFGMLKQNRNPSKEFENLIISVLFATRLPKSTIIIALEYMNQRFSSKFLGNIQENEIFMKLIVALILGNKFNDDNTFTNKSWSGATALNLETLNNEESEWLREVKWQLNVVNFESNIQTLEECWKTWLDKYTVQPVQPVSPTNTYQPQSYSSIPSSPIYSAYQSSPILSSPVRYTHESIWSDAPANPNIWSYTPSYQYVLDATSKTPRELLNQYNMANNFVGYTNPYYCFNMA